MKTFINAIVFFLILIPFSLNSQVGIEFLGNKNTYKSWNDVLYNKWGTKDKLFEYSYGAGINYWFRLKNFRLEFTPGVYYLYSQSKISNNSYTAQTGGLEFDMNIYMFDFISRNYERDCPTFSHQGEWFRKSFFIQVSPGILGAFRTVENSGDKGEDLNIAGKFDFGLGLDMKITDHLILAPIIKYGFYIGEKWTGFSEFHGDKSYNDITPGNYLNLVLNFYLK